MTTTVLEIRGDSTSLQRAAKQAGTALDETSRKADRLATSAKVGGNNLSAAFGATGGGIAVTRGLVSVSDGFRSANSGMALFAASQALLDAGRLANDMGEVGKATGATGGAFSKLGAIIKANPLLTIATVIAGAATAMGLFGDETEEAASAFDRLAEAQRKAQLSQENREFLGIGAGSDRSKQISGIEQLSGLIGSGQQGSLFASEIAKFANVSLERVLLTADSLPSGAAGSPQRGEFGFAGGGGGNNFTAGGLLTGSTRFGPETARLIIRAIYRDLTSNVQQEARNPGTIGASAAPGEVTAYYGAPYGPTDPRDAENQRISQYQIQQRQGSALRFGQGALGPGNVAINFGAGGGGQPGDLIRQSAEEQQRVAQESADRAVESMNELVRSGQQFGATLGDAFFNASTGAASLRQIVAQIALDLARQGAREGGSALFGAVARTFGQTGTQASENATPSAPE